MRLLIAAIGKAREEAEAALCQDFLTRARKSGNAIGFSKIEMKIAETGRASTTGARIADEAQRLAALIPPGAYVFALDERGKSPSSEDFAKDLARLRDSGTRDCVFVIGGPDGLDESLRARASARIAFGAQTWPHLMVRAMLAEQIYRAFSILSGHPYHRGEPAKSARR